MDEEIKRLLSKELPSPKLERLLKHLQSNLSKSRGVMGKEYGRWKRHLKTFKGERPADREDMESAEDGTPEKFVVPLTFAQVQTFASFCFLLFNQKPKFFETEQVGDEDNEIARLGEDLLHGEMLYNRWPSKLYMLLIDIARFGIGITKESWKRDTVWVPNTSRVQNINGFELPTLDIDIPMDQEILKFEGNTINNISPFRFFPDMSLPITRWREGQFVIDEEEYHINQLKKLERAGTLAGVKWVKKMELKAWEARQKYNTLEALGNEMSMGAGMGDQSKKDFVVTLAEHYIRLVPSDWELGPEKYEVMYLIRVANDQRIVSAERYGYVHDEFPHNVGLMSPDTCTSLSASLCDSIDAIQDVITYLINSRVMGLKKNLGRNLIVDPSVIDMASLENEMDIITTVQGAPKNGLDRYAMQLNFKDNTSSNFNDANELQRIMHMVTGVNDNAMGMVASGRRSATENRAANGGAAARMKVTATNIWTDMLAPQGAKMLCNLRYGLSFEAFQKYVGERPNIEELYAQFSPQDISQLVGARDVFIFDNTSESEKGFLAQSMQELLIAIATNPQLAGLYDLDKLMEEVFYLRGVKSRRFKFKPAAGGLGQIGGPPAVNPTIPGVPPPAELPIGQPLPVGSPTA
jgi:hypothetical protein